MILVFALKELAAIDEALGKVSVTAGAVTFGYVDAIRGQRKMIDTRPLAWRFASIH